MTGCVCRESGSGRLTIMVSTEPSVVPIHSVGTSAVGSATPTHALNLTSDREETIEVATTTHQTS